jgi:hypothetical protein
MRQFSKSTDGLSSGEIDRRAFLATFPALPILGAAAPAAPESPAADPADAALAGAAADLVACVDLMVGLEEERTRLEEQDVDDELKHFLWYTWRPAVRRMRRAEGRLLDLMRDRGAGAVVLGRWIFSDDRHELVALDGDGLDQMTAVARARIVDLDGIPLPPPLPSRKFDIATREDELVTAEEGPGTTLDDAIETAVRATERHHDGYNCESALFIWEGDRLLAEVHPARRTKEKIVRHD